MGKVEGEYVQALGLVLAARVEEGAEKSVGKKIVARSQAGSQEGLAARVQIIIFILTRWCVSSFVVCFFFLIFSVIFANVLAAVRMRRKRGGSRRARQRRVSASRKGNSTHLSTSMVNVGAAMEAMADVWFATLFFFLRPAAKVRRAGMKSDCELLGKYMSIIFLLFSDGEKKKKKNTSFTLESHTNKTSATSQPAKSPVELELPGTSTVWLLLLNAPGLCPRPTLLVHKCLVQLRL